MDTSEKQIKRIVLSRMARCSVCHHEFHDDDIQVLSRKDDMWMMVVTCTECHGRNFVAAVLGDHLGRFDGHVAETLVDFLERRQDEFLRLLEVGRAEVRHDLPDHIEIDRFRRRGRRVHRIRHH